jgi:hypothetical protein
MKVYELTDKGKALLGLSKPRHSEPTNWEHCCSCCSVLEVEKNYYKDLYYNLIDDVSRSEVKSEDIYG